MPDFGVNEIVRLLDLAPHPEGGWYHQTYQTPTQADERASATVIHYLLAADQVSAWHKVDADEGWFWHAGAPLALTQSPPDGKGASSIQLGPDLRLDQKPHHVIPADHWQTAESLGAWTLVSCMVAPGFQFSGFEMAPGDWRPTV
ncbi:MAG: cupin domain-containing protein [Pseudomonadota bacterium]